MSVHIEWIDAANTSVAIIERDQHIDGTDYQDGESGEDVMDMADFGIVLSNDDSVVLAGTLDDLDRIATAIKALVANKREPF